MCFWLFTVSQSRGDVAVQTNLPVEHYWQTGSACGPNALYCLLKATGRDVDYKQLLISMSPDEKGSSLEDMREAAKRYGLETNAMKLGRQTISNIPTPFIAHFDENNLKHWVLVLNIDRESFGIWNAEKGQIIAMKKPNFFRKWSGYVLSQKQNAKSQFIKTFVFVELAVAVFLVLLRTPRILRVKKFNITTF